MNGPWHRSAEPPSERPEPSSPVPPRVSVIIPTHGRPDLAIDALRSTLAQSDLADGAYEVLVVENDREARLGPAIREESLGSSVHVRHVHEPRPGLHRARHRGAAEARGDILVYVDDDVVAPPDWLAALTSMFDDTAVAVVGGPVRPDWESPLPEWVADFPMSYFSLLDGGAEIRDLRYPDGAFGCNMAVRRAVLFEVGGFNPDSMGWDPRLFWLRGDGETGLHKRVTDAGYRVVYHPDAGLTHRISRSRLTPKAMRHRGLMVGLSHSFSDIRRTPQNGLFGLTLLARSLRSLAAAMQAALVLVRHPGRQVFVGSEIYRHLAYARQHVLAVFDSRSRSFILRESYLSGEDP